MTLVNTITVLRAHSVFGGDRVVSFDSYHESPEDRSHSVEFLRLYRELWEELGHPQEITVTIQPGDRLNDG